MMKRAGWLGCLLAVGLACQAFATEGGGGAYPNGAEGFMAGAVPPPGNYVINYALYLHGDRLLNDGEVKGPDRLRAARMGQRAPLIHVTATTS